MLLMAAGGDSVDDIEVLRADKGRQRLVGPLPSADVLLTFLHAFHDERLIDQAQRDRPASQVAYIPKESAPLRGLSRAFGSLIHRLAEHTKVTRATLDHDATIQESHKKQALAHYKGGRGYQPSAIYWAELDVVLADEYRDGNVPAAMNNPPLIQRGFAALPPSVAALYFRADSACYETKILKWLANPEREDGPRATIGFTISNRRELAAPPLIRWHWEKAGSIEHVHDVTKNDLAAAVPPCGRFSANAAWYRLSLLTYNVLSAMKWLALPPSMETARPKRMRFALFSIAGRIVSHAGKLVLRIGRQVEALASLIAARIRIAQVGAARIAAAAA